MDNRSTPERAALADQIAAITAQLEHICSAHGPDDAIWDGRAAFMLDAMNALQYLTSVLRNTVEQDGF